MLKNIGLDVGGFIWDSMVEIQLIDEEFMCKLPIGEDGIQKYKKSKALKNLAYHFLGADAHAYEDMVHEYRRIIASNTGRSLEEVSYKEVNDSNSQLMMDYAVYDTEAGWKLHKILNPMLMEQDLMEAYMTDINATIAVIDIEREGFMVDKGKMEEDEKSIVALIQKITKDIYTITMSEFNINSDSELVHEFEKLGITWCDFTDKQELCTDKKVMKKYCESENKRIQALARTVLDYRKASKILSTYILGIKNFIQEDGKVHPDFWVSPNDFSGGSTVTGRLSSSNCNMQNVTKKPVKFEFGEVEEEDDI